MTPRTSKDYQLYYTRKEDQNVWGVLIFKMWANEKNVFCIADELEFYTDDRLQDPKNYPHELIERNTFQYVESHQCSKWADREYKIHNQESSKLRRLRKYHNEICGKYLEWFGQEGLEDPKSPPFYCMDDDFRIVEKDEKTYTLTFNQAAVIKVMYESYIKGYRYLVFNEIIDSIYDEGIHIEATKMSAVFDNNEEAFKALFSYDNRLQKYYLKD